MSLKQGISRILCAISFIFIIGPVYSMELGECISASETKSFLVKNQQMPVASMERSLIKLVIPESQKKKYTFGAHTASGWSWLKTYEKQLRNPDAYTKKHGLNEKDKAQHYQTFKKLYDIAIKRGQPEEITTGSKSWILTANRTFKKWYLLEGNKALGQPSTRFCLKNIGRDLNLVDYRDKQNATSPLNSSVLFDHIKAQESCVSLHQKNIENDYLCSPYTDQLKHFKNKGYNLVIQGITQNQANDGMLRDHLIFSMLRHPITQNYQVLLTTPEGASLPTSKGNKLNFVAEVLKLLGSK